jgi:hypothetical protein
MELDDEELEQNIFQRLQQGAKGIFLWTRLIVEDLSVPGRSIEEYEDTLNDFPGGLDELYGRVLENLYANSARRQRSQLLFQWLACASDN